MHDQTKTEVDNSSVHRKLISLPSLRSNGFRGVKTIVYALQALFVSIAWILTLVVLTKSGTTGPATQFYFALVRSVQSDQCLHLRADEDCRPGYVFLPFCTWQWCLYGRELGDLSMPMLLPLLMCLLLYSGLRHSVRFKCGRTAEQIARKAVRRSHSVPRANARLAMRQWFSVSLSCKFT